MSDSPGGRSQLHNPIVVEQGKTRFYGITALGDTAALFEVLDAGGLETAQICYDLLNPSAAHDVPEGVPAQHFGRLLLRCRERRTGAIVIRVLAVGALNGADTRHPIAMPAVDPIASGPDYATDVRRARLLGRSSRRATPPPASPGRRSRRRRSRAFPRCGTASPRRDRHRPHPRASV